VDRYVVLDDEKAAEVAMGHLISLGHTRIAHIAGNLKADTAQRRYVGYRSALKRYGIPYDDSIVVRADYSYEGGRVGIRALLAKAVRPTAVFAANVRSAIGCLHGAHEEGIAVPGSLSVIAVHDVELAKYLVPPLTTVAMPLEKLGQIGLDLLATSPAGLQIRRVITDDISVVPRGSTRRVG